LGVDRPTLYICTRCDGGERLYDDVRACRKARGLKEVFKVDDVSCLKCCDDAIAIEFSGKKRSTYTRVNVRKKDAEHVVDAAVAYAGLRPGEELRERDLPGNEE
jgi:predicted metal-binding protein